MRPKVIALAVLCLVCVCSIRSQTVDESRSSVILNEKSADLNLVIESSSADYSKKIKLEILNTKSKICASLSKTVNMKRGRKSYDFSIPMASLTQNDYEQIIWYRLRYKVGNRTEIVSLSDLVRENFELRVIATENVFSGMRYRSRIRAIDPISREAVDNVAVKAELRLERKGDGRKDLVLQTDGRTTKDGFAVLDFEIPVNEDLDDDGKLIIVGKKNGLIRKAAETLQTASEDSSFLMLVDKPIYQPNQMLNVRGILLKGAEEKIAVSGKEVEFKIEDEENTLLFREISKTSDFGIASISWGIPKNAKLGDYSIRVKTIDGDQLGFQKIKVSRYDLPNFAVNPKPDKPYYLPADKQAEVEIRADYLFGKPVKKGKVRIVEEKSREWNWKKQKYDIDEGQAKEGEIDAEGQFTAKFDLSEAHEVLDDDKWRRFEDLNFTAYVTDLTTNKTEQRRFDIRVTKEPIHVYFIGERYNLNPNLPISAYVSTFYADGSTAECDVVIRGREEYSDRKFTVLQRLRTNSLGAGKINFMRPKFEDDDEDLEIRIVATDAKGEKGTFGEENSDSDIDFDDNQALKINTKKTLYKPGDGVEIEVQSSLKAGLVYVDVVKGWSAIDSYFVNLKNGKAKLKIPYKKTFQGELKIAAFLEDENDDDEIVRTARGIIFPTPQNLKLEANFDKKTYKPAEEAKVNFSILDAVGNAVESALGVVVFDKAVEERAKTDSEFGGMFGNFYGWLGYGESFGGINVKDLNEIDLTKPISDEMQLVAEVILHDSYYSPNIFHSRNYETDAKSAYANFFKKQFAPFEKALKETYRDNDYSHPTDDKSLNTILAEKRLNFDALRDPWQQKYRAGFSIQKSLNVLTIETAGADKEFGTGDDFAVSTLSFRYFTPFGKKIDEAIKGYKTRTGEFIRNERTLIKELGVSELKDRFDRPYKIFFEVNRTNYVTRIRSIGKDGIYSENAWRGDDFDIWKNSINYFDEIASRIGIALQNKNDKPQTETEFVNLLMKKGIDLSKIKDGYGQKPFIVQKRYSRFSDRLEVTNVSKYGEKKQTRRTRIVPVTQEVIEYELRSKGGNGVIGSYDDFTLAKFVFVISEQAKDDKKPKLNTKKTVFVNGTGAIGGTITDMTGAVIPGATVTATNEESQASRTVTNNDTGRFLIQNLAFGNYSVKAGASNFSDSVQKNVPVKAGSTTDVDFSLSPAGATATVDITSESNSVINTTESRLASNVTQNGISNLPINARNAAELLALNPGIQIDGASGAENTFVIDGTEYVRDEYGKLTPVSASSTPRLRQYFPETLLWSPEVITDKNGKAELKFKMADNITTWKLYTIASTKSGKIGVVEKEVQAFQPFFVDLEPPKFLTQGDEIYLPTQVRNYTENKQKVNVTMSKSDWFSFMNAETRNSTRASNSLSQKIEVASGESENAVFGFRVDKFIDGGKQKVTAVAETDSDAIEKPITVRPNGQEVVKSESKLFKRSVGFDVNFPEHALTNTSKAELKIYPNLFAHVSESVEGLLQRPYGCGEQTISSTYPNLMILKFTPKQNKLRVVAQKFLQKGYERLLGYQISNGGFSYWGGKDNADIALTAYAIKFLHDAKGIIAVDQSVIKRAESWLISQQKADGSWQRQYRWERSENVGRTKMLTSYVAKTLAALKTTDTKALQKSLDYLKTRNEEIDEPYALALFGLASIDGGKLKEARHIAQRLAEMAISEGSGVYWKLETNTPFYGWGTAGRVETTALVVQFMTKIEQLTSDHNYADYVARGTQFLLKKKDRYGVWYSTQTTINVLDAFLATLSIDKKTAASQERVAKVLVNGRQVKALPLPPANELSAVVNVDLSKFLVSTSNRVEIKTNDNSTLMSQIVQNHYVDWEDAKVSNHQINNSRQVKLDYRCDKSIAKIMEDISCEVKAERVGFRGYGMLLAEIGIPPGADVNRESLQDALKNDWSFSKYDILPDRIIVYMWAKAGGTNFTFKFRPRYGIKAQTPASFVYDYYNEEAKATVKPLKFEVR